MIRGVHKFCVYGGYHRHFLKLPQEVDECVGLILGDGAG